MLGKIINKFSLIIGAFASIITIVFAIVDNLDDFNILIKLLIIGIIVIIISLYFNEKHIELIEPKYIEGDKKITDVLVNYLKNTEKSLYYFGGAGFITEGDEDDGWAKTLSNKLKNSEKFKVVRIIDLKKPYELEPLLREMYDEKVYDQINAYQNWIKIHADHLKEKDGWKISFYSYEGAPIWKHGMNYIVFDEKILALITPGTKTKRKLAIIPNHKIAGEFVDSITSVVAQFDLKKLTGKDLEKVCLEDKTESSCCHT